MCMQSECINKSLLSSTYINTILRSLYRNSYTESAFLGAYTAENKLYHTNNHLLVHFSLTQ